MEQALRDCVFWYYLQMKMIYSGLVMILGPFLAFYGQKKLFFLPPEVQSTQFWNSKHGQKWSKLY